MDLVWPVVYFTIGMVNIFIFAEAARSDDDQHRWQLLLFSGVAAATGFALGFGAYWYE